MLCTSYSKVIPPQAQKITNKILDNYYLSIIAGHFHSNLVKTYILATDKGLGYF